MFKEAIYHKIDSEYAYPVAKNKLFLKIRTKRNDCSEINVIHYDKYKFLYGDKTSWKVTMEKKATDEMFDYFEVVIESKNISIAYYFELIGKETIYYANYKFYDKDPIDDGKYFLMPYICEKDIFNIPDWAQESIVYEIFVERFYNHEFDQKGIAPKWYGDVDYKSMLGGNIKGIMAKLDYISDLGVNTIYLTPVFLSNSNHKYNTFDYFTVDPEFGTKEELVDLVKCAHDKGIKVIMDAVFNHAGHEFLPFKDILENGENSRYKDWFDVAEYPVRYENKCNYSAFGYFKGMPKLMTKNKETADYLIEIASYWIREADIDGWRLDVANEIDHAFWRRFRSELKEIKEDIVIIGEVWHDSSSWLQGDQFDTVMNYLFSEAVGNFVANEGKPSEFADNIGFMRGIYRESVCRVLWNLIDSHDSRRFLNVAKESTEKLKLAALIQMTAMGTPMIYYGDEVGMTGGRDPDNRRGMYWDEKQNKDVLEHYKSVIKIRKENMEFSRGDMKILGFDNDKMYFAFERELNRNKSIVYINNGNKDIDVEFEENEGKDLMSGKYYKKGDNIIIKRKSGNVIKIV